MSLLQRVARPAAGLTTVLAVAVLAAGCSGGSSAGPGVANLGATTTTSPGAGGASADAAKNYADAVAYSACMRRSGVPNMPDPTSDGSFLDDRGTINGVEGVDPSSAEFAKANKDCEHLLPNGGQLTPAEQQALLAKAVKFSACIRAHGYPNFPDPKASGGGVVVGGRGIDPLSPRFQAARKACMSLMPLGGP